MQLDLYLSGCVRVWMSAPVHPKNACFLIIHDQALARCPSIDDFFNVVATAKDRRGMEYASIIEGKTFPFTGADS